MSQFYKVLKADPLGEPYTPNFAGAKPTQTYWCQVEGEELAVSIGKQVGNTLAPGQHVYGDLIKATSQKGTNYWKFKSQKVPEGVDRPASSPAQAVAQQAVGAPVGEGIPAWFLPFGNILIALEKDMQLLKGDGDIETPEPAPKEEEPEQTVADIQGMFTPETPDDVEPVEDK